jgi:hypothetical protein
MKVVQQCCEGEYAFRPSPSTISFDTPVATTDISGSLIFIDAFEFRINGWFRVFEQAEFRL